MPATPDNTKLIAVGTSVLKGAIAGGKRKKAPEKREDVTLGRRVHAAMPRANRFFEIKAELSPQARSDGELFKALVNARFSQEEVSAGLVA